jgi:hypothetical protein
MVVSFISLENLVLNSKQRIVMIILRPKTTKINKHKHTLEKELIVKFNKLNVE